MLVPRLGDWMTSRAALLFAAALLAAACSALPEARFPPFVDHVFAAEFLIEADGRLPFPATTRELVVRDLTLWPPPRGEGHGQDGDRWFVYPPGERVRARGVLRAYAGAAPAPPTLRDLLPAATHLAGTVVP